MYRTSNLTVSGLMTELMGFVSEGLEGPFLLTIFNQVYNPHDALAIKNVIELFPQVEIHVAIMAGNTSSALVIAAAVPEERRYLTENGIFSFSKPEYYGQGTYKDLQIAADAQQELEQRMDEILNEAYDLPKPSKEMHAEDAVPRAQEVIGYGFKSVKEIL